mmetsp:Transcript_1615/g.3879  ORF Transcript_1615/g.3879 Transcript_1615/m.3879 type:complete len:100 (+) Transcript_1615:701-1000(+)
MPIQSTATSVLYDDDMEWPVERMLEIEADIEWEELVAVGALLGSQDDCIGDEQGQFVDGQLQGSCAQPTNGEEVGNKRAGPPHSGQCNGQSERKRLKTK